MHDRGLLCASRNSAQVKMHKKNLLERSKETGMQVCVSWNDEACPEKPPFQTSTVSKFQNLAGYSHGSELFIPPSANMSAHFNLLDSLDAV